MKLPYRRRVLHLAAGAAALPVFPRTAGAQSYPSRPVRWIVGFAPGEGDGEFEVAVSSALVHLELPVIKFWTTYQMLAQNAG